MFPNTVVAFVGGAAVISSSNSLPSLTVLSSVLNNGLLQVISEIWSGSSRLLTIRMVLIWLVWSSGVKLNIAIVGLRSMGFQTLPESWRKIGRASCRERE